VTIAELQEDRVVEGVYAVRMKRKLRTKSGASYLALELVDPTGRVEARVWNDVELLDGRFAEGDAVRVLARVEKFRDRLQLDVRSLESTDVDPQTLTPALRRDRDELGGFLEFLVAEVSHPGLRATVEATLGEHDLGAFPATYDDHHSYAGGLLEHTVGVATLARETAQLHPRLRTDLLLAAFSPTTEGRLLGHVHLGLRLIEERAQGLTAAQLAELLHCVAVHHDARAARSAEAAVLYHANQLDAVAATRKVD
jgi:3'-5' exoribonuclease